MLARDRAVPAGGNVMSVLAFNIVLLAAALHATWNAIVKGGKDKLLTTVLIMLGSALVSVVALPVMALPDRASWPYLAASTVLQVVYFVMVASTYRIADMSLAYPLMRGTAPVMVTLASVPVLGEALPATGLGGIGLICLGILAMALGARGDRRGMAMALATACVIASYTMIDGVGARLSGDAVSYTLWLNLFSGLPFGLWLLARRPAGFRAYLRGNWHLGLIGGFGTLASYGLALWAMTQAPIALVAALRETSILFATLISALVLKERVTPRRALAAVLILAGAVAIRLG